jgi:fructosamine-3-kinase
VAPVNRGVDVTALAATVAADLGTGVTDVRSVSGGDINQALRLDLADGRRVFVKSRAGAPAGAFAAEAEGLAWLGEPLAGEVLGVPAVLAHRDVGPDGGDVGYLALAWIEPGPPGPTHDEDLGRGLATVHRAGAPVFGLTTDTSLGSLQLPNRPCATWAEFYGRRRLVPLARRAVDDGVLPPDTVGEVDGLVARLSELVGPTEPPARLHGDLWGGNAMSGAGRPWLIDPAVYGGHREVDLAMMRLFGGFGPRVFAAYEEDFPLAAGHADRVALYQLHPLLVHAVLFGGSYVSSALAVLRRYA